MVEIVARDEEMDVHIQEEAAKAGKEGTLTERITECLKEVGDASIDVDFFVDAGLSMLVTLYDLRQQRVRNPFQSEIVRDIPYEVFSRITERSKVYRGLSRAIRIFWCQQKGKNNFLFFINSQGASVLLWEVSA